MVTDVALHFVLDMSGAVTFACLLRGCKNPEHLHGKLLKPLVRNPWITQAFSALIVAVATVRLVG